MSVKNNSAGFDGFLRAQMAPRLLACAVEMQSAEKRALSQSYPPASKPGEFPHFRTGTGRESVTYSPTSPGDVAQSLSVQVGVSRAGDHIARLEVYGRRLGFRELLRRMAGQFAAILGSGGKAQAK